MDFAPNAQPAQLRLPQDFGLELELEKRLRDQAWALIISGETDPEEFVEMAVVEPERLSDDALIMIYEYLLQARRVQQEQLGDPSQLSNLVRSFAQLNERGIVARANFSCCGTCGASEIWDERPAPGTTKGYLFFHMQDTESLLDSGQTYVDYGAFLDAFYTEEEWTSKPEDEQRRLYGELALELMRNEVFPVLEAAGVRPEWDGNLGTRILLKNVEYYALV
ncbi:hypothetical protein GCM10027417_00440 [Glutamicibacter endophyticus]